MPPDRGTVGMVTLPLRVRCGYGHGDILNEGKLGNFRKFRNLEFLKKCLYLQFQFELL
jgi:hypothetical protein